MRDSFWIKLHEKPRDIPTTKGKFGKHFTKKFMKQLYVTKRMRILKGSMEMV